MPSDTPTKKQYEFPPQHDHMIQQSEDDVATSMAGDQVYVSAPGRKQFQHVWLWDTKYPKDTVTTYNVETHGPSVSKQSPLPDDTELQPHDMAVEMLEIGLVFADDPSKFHEEVRGQASRSKSRQTARDERGVMARNDTWFRAYIKVTDYIQTQAKTSVGCRILDGHLRYKTTSMRNVFFYKEFYPGSDVTTIKDHTSYVAQAIKHYSARIKELQPVTGVDKTASTASQALAPKVAVASNLDRLQMEDQLPPHDNNDGVSIFLAFDENITLNDEDIADLIEIVQPQIIGAVKLQPAIIRAVHEVMCVEKIGERTFGDLFPPIALAFFLEFCHLTIGLPCDSLTDKVLHAIRVSILYVGHSI